MAKLKIGALVFDVSYTSKPFFADGEEAEQRLYGEMEEVSQTIVVDGTISETRQLITLLHETLHVIDIEYQTKLNEPTITCLANGIFDAFRRNKWLREKLLK